MARATQIHQYRYRADLIIDACRLQRARALSPDVVVPHDLNLYLLCVDQLRELARKTAHTLQLAGAKAALDDFNTQLPELRQLRDFLMHPAEPQPHGWVSWFPSSIVRLKPGRVQYLLDVEMQHEYVEDLYERLCNILGELPPPAE